MVRGFRIRFTAAAAIALASTGSAVAQELRTDHPGRAVYRQYCAACHEHSGTRAPVLSALQQMSAQTLRFALTEGVMQQQGAGVPRDQFQQLIGYLAGDEATGDNWVAGMMCRPDQRSVDLKPLPTFAMNGVDAGHSRRLSTQQAGLSSADLRTLELAWAIAFPKVTALRTNAVIVGSTMFYSPTPTGKLLALDVQSACVKWAYEAGVPLRSSMSYGELGAGGRKALIFGDTRGNVHTVDPLTGTLIWKALARHDKTGGITGAPILHGNRIVVPISSSGVGRGADPKHECCEGHGAVVALDAATGEKAWTAHTMEDATYTGKESATGVKLRGPSGAPIWSTPAIDAKRNLVYSGTGQATSLPATNTSDAILAIDIASGQLKWAFQALARDVWHLGCQFDPTKSGPNCPSGEDSVLKDYDFGAAVVIAKRRDGRDILVAGQKSGDLWGLDPDASGKVLWRQTFGTGTPLGGIHWGLAADDQRVYAPINDPQLDEPGFVPHPGMNAVDIETGKIVWQRPVQPDCGNGREQRYPLCGKRYGLSAAPLVVDKSVVAAAIDGRIFIYDGASGDIVWQYDALRDFETLNGVPGKGGGVDSHSIFAGAGMLFFGAGYGQFGQPPGNVLLAFRPKKTTSAASGQ
jgi:polyvinyl alcohol dehydrogenase (cytochrome)